MTQFHLFARRVGLVGLTQLVVGLQGLILLPILTKNLSIENYGIWAQIMVTIGIVPQIALLGLPFTLVRYIPAIENREDLQEVFYSIFSVVLFATIIASIALYLFSEQIADLLFEGNLIVTHILVLIVFLECLIMFFINYLRAKQYIKKYSSIMLSKTLLMVAIVGFFVLSGYGITGAVSGLLVIDIILFIILSILVYNDVGLKFPHFHNLKEYLNFGIPTIPGNLSSWVVNSSDRYVIGILLGTSFVGFYSPGYSLGGIIKMIGYPLSFLLPSMLSDKYDKNQIDNVKVILTYSFKYFMIVAIPATLGLSLLSKPLLTILSTPEIAEKSYLITPFIALTMLLSGSRSIIGQIILLEKQTHINAKIWIIAAILNLVLNILFIPYIGIIGAAFTTLLSFGFGFIITAIYSNKLFTFEKSLLPIIKSVLSSSVMCVPILIYNPTTLSTILLFIALSVIIYFVLMYLLNTFKKDEILFFKSVLNKIKD